MSTVAEGTLLWEPSAALQEQSTIRAYMTWLRDHKGLAFDDYHSLWEWSTTEIELFWESIWQFFDVQASQPYEQVLSSREMPGAHWFVGAELNFAEHVFRHATAKSPAMIFQSERHPIQEISWADLRQQVASVAAALRSHGVQQGDRVVAYMPNIPEAAVAFLACASIGVIWSSCSPDFGSASVIDRFKQIEPKVLIATDGYSYGGKPFDRRSVIGELQQSLPTLEQTILIPYLNPETATEGVTYTLLWDDVLATPADDLRFEQVSFEHPLWVLYSSGTTGLPKPIVQGHGGILLEHLKVLSLHLNVEPGDRFFWFTTTGWMMWNFLVGALLRGCTILVYDGNPGWPDLNRLWEFAQKTGMNFFGTSAGYLTACMKAGLTPGTSFDLSKLKGIGSTASPLPPEAFVWVYQQIKADMMLISFSGGTDICTGVVGGCPLLPIYSGEIQCRQLGCRVESFDIEGNPLLDQMGEFVMTQPLPSMPLFFWNDPDTTRYRESYFEMYPGVWRHGDWAKITPRGGIVIYGRSDATINRMGIRMGTSDIYRAVEDLSEVRDSLVLDVDLPDKASYMPLFVVLREGLHLDDELARRIKGKIRSALSPRHVPDDVFAVPDIPRTLSGKKLEIPVKKLFMGIPIEKATNPDAMSNPQVIPHYAELAAQFRARDGE